MSLSTAEKLRLLLSSNSSQASAAAAASVTPPAAMAPVFSTSSTHVPAGLSAPAASRSASVPTQLLLSATNSGSASSSSASSASASVSPALSSAVDTLIRTYELPVDSSALEQIELCLEAALLCSASQAMRKFGFFLVQAAGLYQELHQYAACTAILQSIQPIYKIHTHMQRQTAESAPGLSPNADYAAYLRSLSADRRFERGVTGERWVAVQRSILEHIIYTAHKTNDVLLSAYSALHLLSALHSSLDLQYQTSLTDSLSAMSSSLPVNTRVDCVGLPSLRFLCPIPLQSSQLPRHEASSPAEQQRDARFAAVGAPSSSSSSRLERISAGDADVFLFSPESGSAAGAVSEAELQWGRRERQLQSVRYACGEMLQVEAVLVNPLRVPLRVQSIQLQTEGVEFAAFPSHALLPPESGGVRLLLTGKAMAAGSLCIVGCLIRCFNLVSEHPVDRSGEGIQPEHLLYARREEIRPDRPPVDVYQINIEPPMPLLECRLRQDDGVDGLSFYVGESAAVVLRISNHSSMPVADVDLALQPLYASNSSQQQISYYSEAELQAERAMAAAQQPLQSSAADAAAATQSALSSQPTSRRSSMSAIPMPASATPRLRSTSSATSSSLGSPSAALSLRRAFDFGRGSSSHAAAASTAASAPGSVVPPVERRRSVVGSTGASPLQWSLPTLLQSLPIQPGQEVDVVVRMQAKQECCGFEYRLCYAETGSSLQYRLSQQRVSWEVRPALLCKHAAILPSLTAPPSPSSGAAAVSAYLLLDVANTADADMTLTMSITGGVASPPPSLIRKLSDQRLLFPLPFFSFGAADDRRLLSTPAVHRQAAADSSLPVQTLASSSAASSSSSTPAALSSLHRSCLSQFHARVRLTWRCADSSRAGLQRDGQLVDRPQLTLHELACLLPPAVSFHCWCLEKEEAADADIDSPSPPALSPSSASSLLPALSRPWSLSSAQPLVRNVSNVLMPERAARSASQSSAAPSPSSRTAAAPPVSLSPPPASPSLPARAVLPLSGFGPHRVVVGAFVQITVEVRLNTVLFNSLTLQLRVTLDGEQQQQHSHPHTEQQPAIITGGSLSPLLPLLAPHSSVRHVFTVCCLAKGHFSFRLQCSTRTSGHQPLLRPEAVEGAAADTTQSRFASLHEAMDRLMAERRRDAADKGDTSTAAAQSSDGSSLTSQRPAAPSTFPSLQFECPHVLILDAAV